MKALVYTLSGALAVLALAVATPALAQGGQQGGGGGGVHGGGGGMGGAGGGGSNGPAGSSGMSAASGGGTSGSSGGFSGGGSSGGFSGGSSGGGFSGGSSSGGFSGGGSSFTSSPMGGARTMGGDRSRPAAGGAVLRGGAGRNELAGDPANRAIPGGSRPNYGNPTIGTAVPRDSIPSGGSGGATNGYVYPYWWWNDYYNSTSGLYGYWGYRSSMYSPYAYYPYDPFYLYGYGAFGLGSLYFNPLWMDSYWGYYGGAFRYSDSMAGGGYSSSSSSGPSVLKGGLKLKVSPKDAEVYVDGYYIGRVDDYNGAFQRLELPVGLHRIELRAKGYNNVSFEVKIEPRDTVAYRGTMQALQPVK